jgi:hypothetical protein
MTMEDTLRQLQDEFHVAPANAGTSGPRAFTGGDGPICTHQDSDFQQVRLESRDIELRVYGDAAIWWRYRMRDASIRVRTIDGLFRVTQVWTKEAAWWRLAAMQYTPLPRSQSPASANHSHHRSADHSGLRTGKQLGGLYGADVTNG